MLKQAIRKLTYWAHDSGAKPDAVSAKGVDMLLEHLPRAMLVHPIANGYILRIENNYELGPTGNAILLYAPDERGIADEIIAHQARTKLDVPRQGELFDHAVTKSPRTTKSAPRQIQPHNAQNRST